MGYARQTALADAYICDTKEDLNLLPHSIMGSTCWVISENLEYICNSKNKWLPKYNKENPAINLTDYYTKKEIDSQMISIPKEALTTNEVLAITSKNS